ncbi:MFS transporter [Hephaestia sp. GCM10023244]|uniref:MFS transporter n=1 Tax=unclassified Hephaestia TaxID=2631281 RepID=UPI00207771A3|nr:MFS transporter [Hephaestia sp. MAHUQ-44]MCM8732486.1 MFS transporter [Hephaestia sp. MAHUQ-44]
MALYDTADKPSRRAWGLLVALLLLNILNFVDRILPQAFIVDITDDVGISYTTFALIGGPIFGIIYAVMGLVMGGLADRLSRPRLIAVGMTLWSVMTAATGFARNALHFGLARSAVAIGEASLSPSALSMLADVFPRSRQGTAASLYYLGISIGSSAAYLIAGSLGASIGWRGCFIALGVLGALLALPVLLLRDPRPRDQTAISPQSLRSVFGQMARDVPAALRGPRSLKWVLLAIILIQFSQGASILDQAWLVREVGLEKAYAQTLVGMIFMIGSIAGALLGGVIADWFARRWATGRIHYAMVALLILTPAALGLRIVTPLSPMFITFLLMVSAGYTLFYGAFLPLVQDLTSTKVRASMIAVTLLSMALLGTALGNVFAGALADIFGAWGVPTPLRMACIVTNGIAILALPCLAIAARTFTADRERYGDNDGI